MSGIQKENNDAIQHAVDEIILQGNEKLSVKDETYENIDDEVDEDDLYKLDKMSFDEKEWQKRAFESEQKYVWYKNRMVWIVYTKTK